MKKLVSLVLAAVLAVSAVGCGSSSDSSSSTADSAQSTEAAADGATFKIGGIGPITGGAAIYGQAVMNAAQMQPQYAMPMQNVNVQSAQFQPFNAGVSPLMQEENIDLVLDVPLEVTVELGRTNKSIKEILDFSPGTIIELDKLAGEPVDVLVNGKFVAKGEVVVIEENFGIRLVEISK